METTRACRVCKGTDVSFAKQRENICKPCYNAKNREWYHAQRADPEKRVHISKVKGRARRKNYSKVREEQPERHREYLDKAKDAQRVKRYGLRPGEYADRLRVQGPDCACCGDRMLKPCLDHQHNPHRVRDFLCHHCNVLLGACKEDIRRLGQAAAYLRRHRCAA